MKKIVLLFSVLVALTACGTNNTEMADPVTDVTETYETIDLDSIADYVDDGYTVVDVREADEYASGHIPNALHAPLSALENGDFTPLKSDEKYVIICRSGNRSVTASNILYDAGYHVVNVSEGMSTWTGEIEK